MFVKVWGLVLLCFWLGVVSSQKDQSSDGGLSRDKSHPARSIYWRSNTEGFFSHFIQLKLLVYARKVAKSDRIVMIEDFHSKHYAHALADTRICNILQLPNYIQCVPYRASENRIPCGHDLRIMYSPNDHVCFAGYPYWANTKQLTGRIRHEVAPSLPRLTFKGKYLSLVQRIKDALQITSDYVAIQWRRGDQQAVRCDRNVSPDKSLNCGDGHNFIKYLNETVKVKYAPMPVVLLSNENDTSLLQQIKEIGVIVINEDVVVRQLNITLKTGSSTVVVEKEEPTTQNTTLPLAPSASSLPPRRQLATKSKPTKPGASKSKASSDKAGAKKTAGKANNEPQKKKAVEKDDDDDDEKSKSKKKAKAKPDARKDSASAKNSPTPKKTPPSQKQKKDEDDNKKSPIAKPGADKRVTSKPPLSTATKKAVAAEAAAALTQLAIDSIFQLDAKVFLTFGISTYHDVIEAERMLRGKSFCTEPQGVMSFCHALTDPNRVALNSTILPYFSKAAVNAFLQEHNPREGEPTSSAKSRT